MLPSQEEPQKVLPREMDAKTNREVRHTMLPFSDKDWVIFKVGTFMYLNPLPKSYASKGWGCPAVCRDKSPFFMTTAAIKWLNSACGHCRLLENSLPWGRVGNRRHSERWANTWASRQMVMCSVGLIAERSPWRMCTNAGVNFIGKKAALTAPRWQWRRCSHVIFESLRSK